MKFVLICTRLYFSLTAARESVEIAPSSEIAKKLSRLMLKSIRITMLRRKLAAIKIPVKVSMVNGTEQFLFYYAILLENIKETRVYWTNSAA